ncbi:MAG: phospho-N-acetylmuramoyl-pentapeptide-transferase [Alphaproteobacteria bacterium]|nr:phospho-N-acetylmuramoyl-pentapeptide-transferase [Alphaproteobacteria bacterium]
MFELISEQALKMCAIILTAFAACCVLMPRFIVKMRTYAEQPIRDDGPQTHLKKQGTPTLGGLVLLASLFLNVLLWGNLHNVYIQALLIATAGMALLGFIDDYLKIKKKNSRGVTGKQKLFCQFSLAFFVLFWINAAQGMQATQVFIPFIGPWDIGFLYYIFGAVVIVGTSNAVNLTDGLDGLVSVPLIIANLVFTVVILGLADYALVYPVLPEITPCLVFTCATIGATLGFLWFNAPPAKIFMGDTGSMALGAALGTLAVITKHELLLALVGGVFVAEAVSDILQVGSYKLRKKRIFKMAPIHHHFEKSGWAETCVVVRFWIISVILACIGLACLQWR